MFQLAFTMFLVVGAPASSAVKSEPNVGVVALSALGGAAVGGAAGIGAGFAIVYATDRNGCYFGGCDAPLLVAIPLGALLGIGGAAAGAVAGGVVGAMATTTAPNDAPSAGQ